MDCIVHGILRPERVAFPFSKGSSQPRDPTQVSHITGRFFTSWATREAQEYRSGYPIPSPADLPDPGIQPASAALQADSLPTELSGKGGHKLSWSLVAKVQGFRLCSETECRGFKQGGEVIWSRFGYVPQERNKCLSDSFSYPQDLE